MTATPDWLAPAYMNALAANLRARLLAEHEDLEKTQVFTGPAMESELTEEAYVMLRVRSEDETASMGGGDPGSVRNEERWVLEGIVRVTDAIGEMGSEEAVVAARARCNQLLGYLASEIRQTPNQTAVAGFRMGVLTGKELDQGISPEGNYRICQISWNITVATRTNA